MQVLSIGKRKRVYSIAFSPDGSELATISGDCQLRIWNLTTGEVRLSTPVEESPCGYDLAFLTEDELIFAGSNLRYWELTANKWHDIAPGFVWARRVKVSPDRSLLVEVDQTRSTDAAAGNGLVIRETSDWSTRPTMPEAANTTGGVAFSADGKFLATGHMALDGTSSHQRNIHGMLYQYQTNDYDYLVHVRELPSGRIVQSLGGWGQAVTHLAFSPDGSVLAGTAGSRLRIWDLQADRELALHTRGPKHFQGLSFAHDGSFLATVSNDTTARVWDTKTWQEHASFTWQIGSLLNIAFAPDGLRAAAGSDQGKVIIWDVE